MRRGLWLIVSAGAIILLASNSAGAQCAMCRQALQSPEGRQMIAAFRSGILLLLGAPFAVFGTVALLALRRFRRKSDPPAA